MKAYLLGKIIFMLSLRSDAKESSRANKSPVPVPSVLRAFSPVFLLFQAHFSGLRSPVHLTQRLFNHSFLSWSICRINHANDHYTRWKLALVTAWQILKSKLNFVRLLVLLSFTCFFSWFGTGRTGHEFQHTNLMV